MAEVPANKLNTNNKPYKKNRNRKPKRQNNYIPSGNPELLSKTIEELEFKERTQEIIIRGGVKTVRDLLVYREKELYRIQNFNKKSLVEVVAKIKSMGLSFRPEEEQQQVANPLPKDDRSNRIKVYADGRIEDRSKSKNKQDKLKDKIVNTTKFNKKNRSVYDCSAIVGKYENYNPKPMRKEKASKDSYSKFCKNNKYGFRDFRNNVVIEPTYDDAFNFKEGLACVEKDGLYGYIDLENNVIIPFKYELAMSFSEDLACVTIGEKSGYIDKQGEEVIPMQYDAATSFSEGFARVKVETKWGMITKDNKLRML